MPEFFEEEPRPDDQQPGIETGNSMPADGHVRKESNDIAQPELSGIEQPPKAGDFFILPNFHFDKRHEPPVNVKRHELSPYESSNEKPDRPYDPYYINQGFDIDISAEILKKLIKRHREEMPSSMGIPDKFTLPEEKKKPEKTGPTLDDIGGYEDAKEQIRKFLAAAQHPEKFREWGAKPPKGLLLYGPPGTGKTMFAKAIATELNGHFEAISPADINSKWFGESEERIKKLFEDARGRDGHTVIFIDEIDSMLPRRDAQLSDDLGGVKDSIMTMFLQYMDGKDSPDNITIVGATNRLDAIDPAVLRPGRIDRKIEIGYPDPEARAAILNIHIAAKEKAAGRKLFDLDEEGLHKLLKGADVLTGAQIAEVVRRTCESKAYEALENGGVGLVTVDDLAGSFASLIAESARYDS